MGKLAALFCCAIASCLMVAGCSGSGALRNQLVGTWDYDPAALALFVGDDLTDEQVQAVYQLAFLNLNEDGSAEFALLGDVRSGEWEVDGEQIAITIGGESTSATLEDGVLAIGEGDSSLSFVKAGEVRTIPTKDASATAMASLTGLSDAEGETSGEAAAFDPAALEPAARIALADLDEPVTIGDDAVATIAVTAIGTNALGDPGYNLRITNNFGSAVYPKWGEFTVNGMAVTAYGGDTIAPGKTADVFLAFDAADFDGDASPDALYDVWGSLSINDETTAAALGFYDFAM